MEIWKSQLYAKDIILPVPSLLQGVFNSNIFSCSGFQCFQLEGTVQFSSVAQSCPTYAIPRTAAHQASLSITNSWSLLKLMSIELVQFSSVQSLSHVWLFVTPWTAARQASLSITNSRSSLKLTSIESVMPSNHLILCCPLLLLPPIPPSIRVFSNESTLCMRRPKYWSFSFSISPSSEHPGLISFRMDWLDLLAVPGTLKSLLQHHSLKASILL